MKLVASPSERQLMNSFGEGRLYRERAKGTFVLATDHSVEKKIIIQWFVASREKWKSLGKKFELLHAEVNLIEASEKLFSAARS